MDGGAHWHPFYIPNDLMVPVERYDAIITIFSLSYIDSISEMMTTSKKNLQNNFLGDKVFDPQSLDINCNTEEIPYEYRS